MKAAYVERYGGARLLRVGELPQPRPGDGDLLVRVHAASVNPVDFKIRNGLLKPILRFDFPLVLGNDMAGTVVEAGAGAAGFAPGARVFARLDQARIGAFAEYAVVRAENAAPMPATLDFEEAAALPLVALTAWQALVGLARLRAGERVLIHAGAGGVGSLAIQLARHLGARVATTTGERGRELVAELGAERIVDYRRERFEDCVGECDVVLDTQGGAVLARSFKVLRPGGVLVTIGGVPNAAWARRHGLGLATRLALAWMTRRASRLARARQVRYEYLFVAPDGAALRRIAELVDAGALRPVIEAVYPFERVAEALARVEAGHALGKVVLRVD